MLKSITATAGIHDSFALRAARAIERDPSLLERDAELVVEVAADPRAREVLSRIFTRKKVAFRYQHARHAVSSVSHA